MYTATQAAKIDAAHLVLKDVVRHTPLEHDVYLSQKYNCNVYLKREDLQTVRSFKLRGAYYAISRLSKKQREFGVTCASAGNHAQGVAYTCDRLQMKAVIFMPTTTPNQKVSQVRFFGGKYIEIMLVGDTFDACSKAAKDYTETHQMTFIPPFDSEDIIAGQGTVAVEILEDADVKMDYVVATIGGGGLISGVGSYFHEKSPDTKVIGVEPLGAASMHAALHAGEVVKLPVIDKFVDGAAVAEAGKLTYGYCRKFVDDIFLVPEGQVCTTILEMYTKLAIVAEPAGALSVSALEQLKPQIEGKNVVCIVSGGNNDINRMKEMEERSLMFEGLQHYFIVNFPQRAGALKEFISLVLGPQDDITKFEYTKKVNRGQGPVIIGILLKDKADYNVMLKRLAGYDSNYIPVNDNPMLYTLLV
ncbi:MULTISPECIES: threonine ammonia-lyase IlvA [Brochothrix]|uniref:L-threonine dehydratase n=1 Tax=Brochothrix thermosphacta TaxID=2756 RepID=A0A1D2LH59_BROTH|nr:MULTISPECIES: threonine ammonia-lyase IlvA [Brochothrix]SLM96943.1 Threonine dehydratase biosynthetic [Brachybacterium faecium]ATF25272.1 threonine dehydratase [Brochothrix thermosphacta]ATH84655.1 threonine dehydratase [Brochothrix thermosphacta]MBR5525763.1 threonine ammonia-lyase IlvA [Brochothrix sp.]MPQ27706.1 threonine dehydratase [Brochothrix thermosphacta]